MTAGRVLELVEVVEGVWQHLGAEQQEDLAMARTFLKNAARSLRSGAGALALGELYGR